MTSPHLLRLSSLFIVVLYTSALFTSCSDSTPPAGPVAVPAPTAADIEAHNRGVALMGRFDYDKARAAFETLAKQHPTWHKVKVDLAIATLNRQQADDSKAALALLDEVLKADPNHLRAHYCSGLLKLHGGDAPAALTHFRLVAKADPRDAHAAYYVAQCQAEAGDYDAALQGFTKAIELDPYQRSAYYGAFQANQRLGQADAAKQMLAEFEKLKDNPQAKLAEFKYTRMGTRGEVVAVDAKPQATTAPTGPVFLDPVPLPLTNGDGLTWATFGKDERPPSITACDIDGDGQLDLFFTASLVVDGAKRNAVLLQREGGKFEAMLDHPLAKVSEVNAALWGDYDNDGFTDVYLLRRGENQLWKQTKANEWQDVTATTLTAGEELDSVDGAIFDADHDDDLDLFVVNRDGPNELFNNNLDGTFRGIAKERGIAGDGKPSRQVVVADIDNDRDVDILVIKETPPHDIYLNDRLWTYRAAPGFAVFQKEPVLGCVAVDFDPTEPVKSIDGQLNLYTCSDKGWSVWSRKAATDGSIDFEITMPSDLRPRKTPLTAIMAIDMNGDGLVDSIVQQADRWDVDGSNWSEGGTSAGLVRIASVTLSEAGGPAIIGAINGGPPSLWSPGPGRFPFTTLTFTGKEDKGDQLRSNRSGIGVRGAARIGARWTAFDTFRNSSGPGQTLQPISLGLGGAAKIDFVTFTWPDGVMQTEMALDANSAHRFTETQRQLSSCPVLYVWDGTKYEFVTDFLGVGGIGFNVGNGEYGPPRPWENLMIPGGLMKVREDASGKRYVLKIGEPMEEACYLDAARLVAYDLPTGWRMTLDERFAIADPQPTGEPVFYRHELMPVMATSERDEDVTSLVSAADLKAAPVGRLDPRFIGRTEEHGVTLTFDQPIATWAASKSAGPESGASPQLLLLIDGWIEYPYSQTMFSAWQAKADYTAPSLEARGSDGQWHMVIEQWGFPAGMPRQMSLPVPLDKLPAGTTALRMRSRVEVYFDRLSLVLAEPCPQAKRIELPLMEARVAEVGYALRTTGPQRQPHYDYQQRSPLWDARHQSGWYTALGRCDELVNATDDATAIIGPGEEVHMEFDADALPATTSGSTRMFILETTGWCKDMDLYTKDGDTLTPLPHREGSSEADLNRRDELHRKYNTRYRSGG